MSTTDFPTIYAALRDSARRYPQHTFLHIPASASGTGNPVELTYAATLAQVDRITECYRARGVGVGDRVALLLENRAEYLLHFFALNALGVCVVPLNPDYQRAELEYVLDHSEARLAVALPHQLDRLKALGRNDLIVASSAEPFALPPLDRASAASAARTERPGPDTHCVLLYTSGTTGKPKGCIITNYYCIAMGRHYNSEGGLCAVREGQERLITPLPLFHMNALCASTMAMLLSGGCVIQLDRFHPKSWWAEVVNARASIVHYLGVMPAILLGLPVDAQERAHGVRFGYGANANPKDHQAFEQRFGIPLIEAWAMTETGSGACVAASREPRHVGTRCIGTPRPGIEMRLVDEHENDVADGEPGELLVRHGGPDPRRGFFSGYLKDEAATEHAWRGGWFHTGDAVRRGPDGLLHFVDRKKNIIRRSGENIAALEVEAALLDHPAIGQIAVIAAPDAVRDEEVMACVVAQQGATRDRATAESIQDWCLQRLAYYKAPGYVAFIDALPTTATNKVQKARLADFGADPLRSPECFDLRARKKRS